MGFFRDPWRDPKSRSTSRIDRISRVQNWRQSEPLALSMEIWAPIPTNYMPSTQHGPIGQTPPESNRAHSKAFIEWADARISQICLGLYDADVVAAARRLASVKQDCQGSFPDSWADHESISTLGFCNLHHLNSEVYILDAPRSLG